MCSSGLFCDGGTHGCTKIGATCFQPNSLVSSQLGCPASTYVFCDDWNIAATGTVNLIYGTSNHTVTGTGTSFKALFCNGGTVSDGSYFVLWYPDPTVAGRIGRWYDPTGALSCTDDTHLALAGGYTGPGGTIDCSAGCQYARSVNLPGPLSGTSSWNYYSGDLAYYNLWLSTGLTRYQTYARALVNKTYTAPGIDQWQTVVQQPRVNPDGGAWAMLTLDPTSPTTQSSLLLFVRNATTKYGPYYSSGEFLIDPRANAYAYLYATYQANLDPDTSSMGFRAQAKALLPTAYTQFWLPNIQSPGNYLAYWGGFCPLSITSYITSAGSCFGSSPGPVVLNAVNGSATMTVASGGSLPSQFCATVTTSTGTVSVTNGSPSITGAGGASFTGTANQFIVIFGTKSSAYYKEIATISSGSGTSLTMADNWHGDTASGLSYQVISVGPFGSAEGLQGYIALGFENTDSNGTPINPNFVDTQWYMCRSSNTTSITLDQPYDGPSTTVGMSASGPTGAGTPAILSRVLWGTAFRRYPPPRPLPDPDSTNSGGITC